MAMRTIDGITANFQEGGWYGGRQYSNGTLGAAGVINNPNQIGYGQAVSKEVVNATSPNNWDYIQKQNNQLAATPAGNGAILPSGGGAAPASTSTNLQDAYKNLMNTPEMQAINAEIDSVSKELNDKQNKYNEATTLIDDNPYLAEATRVGKQRTLDEKYSKDVLATQSRLQTLTQKQQTLQDSAKTQIDLQTKQAELDKPQTQVINSTDDAGNVTASIINTSTGQLISQMKLGKIDKATKVAGTETAATKKISLINDILGYFTGAGKQWPSGKVDPTYYSNAKEYWLAHGGDVADFDKQFAPVFAEPTIYEKYGISKELVSPDAFKIAY